MALASRCSTPPSASRRTRARQFASPGVAQKAATRLRNSSARSSRLTPRPSTTRSRAAAGRNFVTPEALSCGSGSRLATSAQPQPMSVVMKRSKGSSRSWRLPGLNPLMSVSGSSDSPSFCAMVGRLAHRASAKQVPAWTKCMTTAEEEKRNSQSVHTAAAMPLPTMHARTLATVRPTLRSSAMTATKAPKAGSSTVVVCCTMAAKSTAALVRAAQSNRADTSMATAELRPRAKIPRPRLKAEAGAEAEAESRGGVGALVQGHA
mmetsp:Transcript_20974/g.63901  ORF Transcript_20974/g.63901 Transcript_20974/m.63901 type:complete len:264 (+) Transcript_20974:2446-3237(+)